MRSTCTPSPTAVSLIVYHCDVDLSGSRSVGKGEFEDVVEQQITDIKALGRRNNCGFRTGETLGLELVVPDAFVFLELLSFLLKLLQFSTQFCCV